MEEIEIMGRSLAEIKRIIAWYESLGSPSLFETDQQRELIHKQYEEAKKAYEAIPPNINANPIPTRSGETRQMYIPEPSMGDRMRANLKETLDIYCPYLPITEDAVAIHPSMGTWHIFGQRQEVSFDEMSDIGRVLIGDRPRRHEWVMISKDRSAYCLGPRVA